MKYRIKKINARAIKGPKVLNEYFIIQWRFMFLFWFNHREMQGLPLESETVIFPSLEEAKAKIKQWKSPKKVKTEIIQVV